MTATGKSLLAQRTIKKVRVLQETLYRAAKENLRRTFGVLYDKVCRWEVLWEAWYRVRRNRGAPGVDGRTIEAIKAQGEVEFIRGIQAELVAKQYRPVAVRRVFMPKGRGRFRALGIPVIKDRGNKGPNHSRSGSSGPRADFRGEFLRRVIRVSSGAWLSGRDCGDSEVGYLRVQSCNRCRCCRVFRFNRPRFAARTSSAAGSR